MDYLSSFCECCCVKLSVFFFFRSFGGYFVSRSVGGLVRVFALVSLIHSISLWLLSVLSPWQRNPMFIPSLYSLFSDLSPLETAGVARTRNPSCKLMCLRMFCGDYVVSLARTPEFSCATRLQSLCKLTLISEASSPRAPFKKCVSYHRRLSIFYGAPDSLFLVNISKS